MLVLRPLQQIDLNLEFGVGGMQLGLAAELFLKELKVIRMSWSKREKS